MAKKKRKETGKKRPSGKKKVSTPEKPYSGIPDDVSDDSLEVQHYEDIQEPEAEEERFISKPVALFVSVILIMAILVLGYLFLQSLKGSLNVGGGESISDIPMHPIDQDDINSIPGPGTEECLKANGWDMNTPIFSYLDSCPYCEKMIPRIVSLESEGYSFSWVERSQPDVSSKLYSCLGGVVRNSVPQIICPKTRKERIGVLSENEIRNFAKECKNS
ncbi:MAG: hypothetical protein ABIG39_01660 [Candidatus Micrarchaeota archaeon]